jgi:hypothetical protein
VDDRPRIFKVLAGLDLGSAVAPVSHSAMLAEGMWRDAHHGVHLIDDPLPARIA